MHDCNVLDPERHVTTSLFPYFPVLVFMIGHLGASKHAAEVWFSLLGHVLACPCNNSVLEITGEYDPVLCGQSYWKVGYSSIYQSPSAIALKCYTIAKTEKRNQ
jgi:hypothetical protein